MFDLPPHEELSDDTSQHRRKRIRSLRESDCIIEGAGPSGLLAGVTLLEDDYEAFIVESSEHIGGRMTWETDPLPIFSPADELLEEFGFPIEENPPVWIDRIGLLTFLAERFRELGGTILTRTSVRFVEESDDFNFEVHVDYDGRNEILQTDQVIRTEPGDEVLQPDDDSSSLLEDIVLQTGRTSKGVIDAGFRCVEGSGSDQPWPLENACLLSGRKAAELAISKLPSTPMKMK